MPRVVWDANVYVCAIIRPVGPPGRVVERFLRDSAIENILSPAIVDETT
jgi:predicted nucleic acid-binding protein